MKIAEIDYPVFERIYKRHLVRDFPYNEQRSLKNIQRLFKKGIYQSWVIMDGDELVAYASCSSIPGRAVSLLEYFAVVPAYREQGIGGRFLEELQKILDYQGLLIECEIPTKATTQSERLIREKRIDFYRKNNAILTDTIWQVGKVVYQILWFPIKGEERPENLQQELKDIYKSTNSLFFNRFLTKVIPGAKYSSKF